MIVLADMALLRPWWLAVAVLLVVALGWRVARDARVGDWSAVVEPHLMQAMAAMGRVRQGGRARVWRHPMIWAVGVIAVALSGPALAVRDARAYRNLDGVVLVVDISRSLVESPAWRDVVTAARSALAAIGTKPAALIVYGGDAYVAAEMTSDTRQIGFTMELLDADTMPDPGSDPARALALAAQMLVEIRTLAGDVLWLTDGGGAGPGIPDGLAALEALNAQVTIVAAETENGGDLAAAARAADLPLFAPRDLDAVSDRLTPRGSARLGLIDLVLLGWEDLGRHLLLLALPMLALRVARAA